MSQPINREKKVKIASDNLDEIMRRIEPFVRCPKEEPIKRQNWTSSGTRQIQITQQKAQ